jgi:hypothetical protein
MFLLPACLAIVLASTPVMFAAASQVTSTSVSSKSVQSEPDKRMTRPATLPDIYAPVSLVPLELPPGENSWTVQIVSRGGFIGAGRGSMTVTSQGNFTWNGPGGGCSRTLTADAISALSKLVVAAEASASWNGSKLTGLCGDCYVTTMLLQRRERDGVVRSYNLTWDDASNAQIPPDALTIYEAFIAHAGCKE